MIQKYGFIASVGLLLVPAISILAGCSQPSSAPEKAEGLTSVPPQPVPAPQTAEPTAPPPASSTPPPSVPANNQPADPPAAVVVPITETEPAAAPRSESPNLLPEAGWEDGYPGWQKVGNVAIESDEKEKLFGARSLRFDLKGSSGFELVRWEVAKGEIKEGDRYLLKGYVKLEDVDPEADVRLTAFTIETKTKRMSWFKSAPFNGTQGWTEAEVRFGIPSGGDALAVRVEYVQDPKKKAKAGKVWVDALYLVQVTGEIDEPMNLLRNGDFDAGASYWIDLPDPKHLAPDTVEKQIQGRASLRIDLSGLDKANLTQWIGGINPNARYRLDGFIKVSDVQGNAFLTVVAENSQRKNKVWLGTEKLSGTSDWRKLSLELKTGADTDTLGVRVEYQPEKPGTTATAGTVWVDNVLLTEIE